MKHPLRTLFILLATMQQTESYAGCFNLFLNHFRPAHIEIDEFSVQLPEWQADASHRILIDAKFQNFQRHVNISFTDSAKKSQNPIFVYATDGQLHNDLFQLIPKKWPIVLISVESSSNRSDEYLGNTGSANFDMHDRLFRLVLPKVASSIFSKAPLSSRTVLFGVSNGAAYVHGLLYRDSSFAKNILAFSMTRVRKAFQLPKSLEGNSIYAVAGGGTSLERLARNFTIKSIQNDTSVGARTNFTEFPEYGHDYEMWLPSFLNGLSWLFDLKTS